MMSSKKVAETHFVIPLKLVLDLIAERESGIFN